MTQSERLLDNFDINHTGDGKRTGKQEQRYSAPDA